MHVTHLSLGATVAVGGPLVVRLALSLASLDAISTSAGQEHPLLTTPFDSISTLQREAESLATVWNITGPICRLREGIVKAFSSTTKP